MEYVLIQTYLLSKFGSLHQIKVMNSNLIIDLTWDITVMSKLRHIIPWYLIWQPACLKYHN